jgi:lipoate-protein ligase A
VAIIINEHFYHSQRHELIAKGTPSVASSVTNLRNYSLTIDHQSLCEAVAQEFSRQYYPRADPNDAVRV